MITTLCLGTICHHTKVLQYFWLYLFMLYLTSPWLIYSISGILYLLITVTNFAQISTLSPPLATTIKISLFLFCSVLFTCFVFLDFYIQVISHLVFTFLWLLSLNIIFSMSIHVVANGKVLFFLWMSNIPSCTYIAHLLYPFICQWTFTLIPYLGYCK